MRTKLFATVVILLMIVGFTGCNHRVNPPVGPPSKDFAISVAFNYNFTNFAICSASVTQGCVTGFTWGYLQGAGTVALKTSAATICTGTTQPEACTDSTNSQLPMGSVTFYVVANFVDNAGKPGQSGQDTTATPTIITAGSPTGLTVTAQ